MNVARTENTRRQTVWQFVLFTLIAALVAAVAAWGSDALALEVWVMFAGFIAWFTRPTSSREGVSAMLCLWLGIGLGAVSHLATTALIPTLGALSLPLVVFLVAILIVGLRSTIIVNNMLAWFLGMVTFFASELGLSPDAFVHLGSASAIGGFAGWTCQTMNRRWAGA